MTERDDVGPVTLPRHVTTPLLTLVTERSLDEDYAHVAAKRSVTPGSQSGRRHSWGVILVLALGAALATVAAIQTSQDADVAELGRAALIREAQSGRQSIEDLQRQIATLSEERQLAATEAEELLENTNELDARRRRLELATGHVAVSGPGVRIQLDSAPNADPNDEVRDADLARLVDGLWVAGADAIAINGERLFGLGGIRNTNRAVHVNGRPLTAPYVIEAIGDTDTLQARLLESSAGLDFFSVAQALEFEYVAQNVQELRLPAARWRALRRTEPLGGDPVVDPKLENGAAP